MIGTETASEFFKTWEQSAAKWWDETLRAPQTLSGLGSALSGISSAKERWDRGLEQAWSTWRLPSAMDVERLHERIGELEDQLFALSAQLEGLSAPAPTKKTK